MPDPVQHPAPDPEKLVNFMRLQVTDALLDSDIFPNDPPDDAASPLFALAILSAVPPVPANRELLKKVFSCMHKTFSKDDPSGFVYNEIVGNYNRFSSVFTTASALPKGAPLGNPYEEVAKAAAYQLGFSGDGVRIFHLTVWMTYYCKDALIMFYSDQLKTSNEHALRIPPVDEAYLFISSHVNNVIADPVFFAEAAPGNATEVLTALFCFITLMLPTTDNGLLHETFNYMHSLLVQNDFPPLFFDRIVNYYERFSGIYSSSLTEDNQSPTNFTFELLAEEAEKMMGVYPDAMLKFNIVSYFPTLITDAFDHLYAWQ